MSIEDKEVGAILRRHHEDAAWFGSGLHDPNGYIYMAHKDRGDLLAKLRQLRTGEKAPDVIWGHVHVNGVPAAGMMVIPAAAFLWLMGEGPDDQGRHFGEAMEAHAPFRGKTPPYWWRTVFRRMCVQGDAPRPVALPRSCPNVTPGSACVDPACPYCGRAVAA